MKVILISGHAQNGKDTFANMLKEEFTLMWATTEIAHYADYLKFLCKEHFGWDGIKDEKGRSILQFVGTDIVRKNNPDFWVKNMADMLDVFGKSWEYVIIPDTRFPNEIDYIKSRGFDTIHIRIERTDFESPLTEEQKNHASETALDGVQPDINVINDSDLESLRIKACKIVEDFTNGVL